MGFAHAPHPTPKKHMRGDFFAADLFCFSFFPFLKKRENKQL
jgi:hypothetical protein